MILYYNDEGVKTLNTGSFDIIYDRDDKTINLNSRRLGDDYKELIVTLYVDDALTEKYKLDCTDFVHCYVMLDDGKCAETYTNDRMNAIIMFDGLMDYDGEVELSLY